MKNLTLFLPLLLLCLRLPAQDAIFSQFYNNRVYLNPAFAGIEQCFVARLHHRSQWQNVPGGFRTYSVTLEMPVPQLPLAFAPFALQDQEGEGALRTTQLGLNLSAFKRLSGDASLHGGFGAHWLQKKADLDRLVFSDQLDPVHGIVQPTAAPPLEARSGVSLTGGAVLRKGFKLYHEPAFSTLGFSIHHAVRPEDGLSGFGEPSPTRYSLHGGATMQFWVHHRGSRKIYFHLSPQFRIEWQKPVTHVSAGCYLMYSKFYVGAFRQFTKQPFDFNGKNHSDALVLATGYEHAYGKSEKNSLRLEWSFNLGTGGLSNQAGGVHEVSLTWVSCGLFDVKDRICKHCPRRDVPVCPKFNGMPSVNFF